MNRLQLPGPKRSRRVISGGWFDADDAALGSHRRGRESTAGKQPAAAAGDEQHVEAGDVFAELEPGRSLSRDDGRIVVRRDQGEAALDRQPAPDRFAVVTIAVVQHDLRAVAFRGRALHGRRVVRHDDDARDVEKLAGERDGGGVIT